MKHHDFDVIVVGGGHAGCEAALAAARMGAKVCMITLKFANIGALSCNPAVGGIGKGHLVAEIDALDGVMGQVADHAGIQFRLLNRSKGMAVQGPRAQVDRKRYQAAMALAVRRRVHVLEGEVVDLLQESGRVAGVALGDGSLIRGTSTVLTTGTFLSGRLHVGNSSQPGGRVGEAAVSLISERLRSFGLGLGRLKTGTPPRLLGSSIDWSKVESQPGDAEPVFFSALTRHVSCRQVACGITHTNEKTHTLIAQNLHHSSLYAGHITGVGPRYCPSIEDKVVRYPDKISHQVFLEPEGLDAAVVYPNGLSTSLPGDLQIAYLRTIHGLETVQVTQLGYAVEYDFVDPRSLERSLMVRDKQGLYLAGQINGTTGYEEAAAQGLVAGLNAAASSLGRDRIEFSRTQSYIGVLIDDLVTRGVTEPYRMFTSRAEFRLSLRVDNAEARLTPLGRKVGCVGEARWKNFSERNCEFERVGRELSKAVISSADLPTTSMSIPVEEKRSALHWLARPEVQFEDLVGGIPSLSSVTAAMRRQLKADAVYSGYVLRQEKDVESLRRLEADRTCENIDFASISGLSHELRTKIATQRPASMADLVRIDGMTPAALMLISNAAKKIDAHRG